MGDAFKLLCFGVQFDKKRFATDITLFEGKKSKPAEQSNGGRTTNKGLKKDDPEHKEQQPHKKKSETKTSAPKRLKTAVAIEDEILENSHMDLIEFSDDPDDIPVGHDPWATGNDEEEAREEQQQGGQEEEEEDKVEYDFSSTDKWEGDGDEMGEEGEMLDYFSTSKKGEETPKVAAKKRKVIAKEKWEVDEAARTGLTVEEAREIRKKLRITVLGGEIPFPLAGMEDFAIYGVKEQLTDNMARLGYHTLTPIQQQAIPAIMCERETVVCAPTGSGKTLCYALPVLHLLNEPKTGGARAVILSPTPELTEQIYRHFKRLSVGIPFRFCLLTKPPVNDKLKIDPVFDIIITTPNRLVFLIKNNLVDLAKVQYLIFDEADKLFDETFIEQVDTIVTACKNTQVKLSLLSATISPVVDELAKSVLKFPIDVHIGARNSAASTIDQQLVNVTEAGKLLALRQVIQKGIPAPVMIFVKAKSRAKHLYDELKSDKLHVGVTHSGLSLDERSNVVTDFRIGKIWFLICTDMMSRGMDFKNVGCVVNYDCPNNRTSYIHRIGRTGRAGQKGKAITFYSDKDMAFIRSIANVVRESGGATPEWMLALTKHSDREAKRTLVAENKNKNKIQNSNKPQNKK